MPNFLGEYDVAVDAKGRFLLPSAIRKQMDDGSSEKFVISRGIESCLTMYPLEIWNKISDRVNQFNDLMPEVREYKRLFNNGATIVEMDSADRLLIPKNLQEHAGINKDVVLSAQGKKIELWDKVTYLNYMNKSAKSYSELAQQMAEKFGNPFENL